jgi:hypothetical protein
VLHPHCWQCCCRCCAPHACVVMCGCVRIHMLLLTRRSVAFTSCGAVPPGSTAEFGCQTLAAPCYYLHAPCCVACCARSLTYHTRKVDRTLLQSIARNKLRKQQQQPQLKIGTTLQRLGTKLRSHHAGATSRAEGGQARLDAAEPQSDNARWQQMQEAEAV